MERLQFFFYNERMKIEHLIFDMDDTLYPGTGKMNTGITRRMLQYVADFFGVNYEQGLELRKKNIGNFSTTLEWLMSEGLNDIEDFFATVHPDDEADELTPDPKLRPFLESIDIPKILLTNAPLEHAERVLEKLNVKNLFDHICDIRFSELKGKPYPKAFKNALAVCNGTIDDTLFIDDLVKYTDGYMALGGTAVQVGKNPGHHLSKDASSACKETPPHPGRTLHIDSIYEIMTLINELKDEQ